VAVKNFREPEQIEHGAGLPSAFSSKSSAWGVIMPKPANRRTKRPLKPEPSSAGVISATGLMQISHIVVLMLENHSFDHMLGFLYATQANESPLGQPYEGLTGNEYNLDSNGNTVRVFQIPANDPHLYYYPKSDPGEGFANTNAQLFGATTPPAGAKATNGGFITNFGVALKNQQNSHPSALPGTLETDIMGMYTPNQLPILSGLARGYAVCDFWFGSAPTETLPNRAFALTGTSQGHLDDSVKVYTAQSIFHLMDAHNCSWAIYGYDQLPLTQHALADIAQAPATRFGKFQDFKNAVQADNLANFVFLEPSWGSHGNSQHPNYDISAGEALINQVYATLFGSKVWNQTLLIITYDEHGGCFDHVPPPANATPPDNLAGQFGFQFTRFGPRVPTVLVSPWIQAGTVYRVPQSGNIAPTPFDHTSVLKTLEKRFGLPALTKRDAAAPDVGGVLTLTAPRTDNPLAGVSPPVNPNPGLIDDHVTHLQQVQAQCLAEIPNKAEKKGIEHHDGYPNFKTGAEAAQFIRMRSEPL
jgi:phospholipase C